MYYCKTFIQSFITVCTNVQSTVDDTVGDEPATMDFERPIPQPRRNKRTYKQDLDVQAKKLAIRKMELEVQISEKYLQTMEATQKAQEMSR